MIYAGPTFVTNYTYTQFEKVQPFCGGLRDTHTTPCGFYWHLTPRPQLECGGYVR